MEESLIKRIPPHSQEAESAVIGSMIMDADAIEIAGDYLTKEDFYQKQYSILFEVLIELYKQGVSCDLVTIQEKLRELETSPEMRSTEFLRGLILSVPSSVNVKDYAKIVREKSMLRRMIQETEKITANCYLDKQSTEEIMEDAEKRIFDISQHRNSGEFEEFRYVAVRTVNSIQEAAKSQGHITGLKTGIRDLDYKTAGLQKSDLILIAARPAMGKTALALNIAEYVATRSHKSVALFSLEMSKEQLTKRLFSMNSRVDSQKLRTGALDNQEWMKLIESAKEMSGTNIFIDDTSGVTAGEIRSKCRKLKAEKGLDLVVIDYLQLMSGSGKRKGENRQQEISEISRALKVMARELDVPVIALSQLSRAVEQRPDKKPLLSDLRESGAIEQDADVVMFIYRDEYYNPDSERKGQAEVIIAKQRSGPTGSIHLAWLAQYTKFGNLELEN